MIFYDLSSPPLAMVSVTHLLHKRLVNMFVALEGGGDIEDLQMISLCLSE